MNASNKTHAPQPDSEALASRNSLVCEKLTSRVNFSKTPRVFAPKSL